MSEHRRYEELLADAVRVLTDVARRPVIWRDADGHEHRDQRDFAEFVTHAVAGAAANIGGVEEILAGRPGSWEADCVRQMLYATVGHYEECLLEHRTEPLTVVVAVDNLLTDLGFYALFDRAHDELDRREEAICSAADIDEGPFPVVADLPAEQQAALEEIAQLREGLEQLRVRDWAAYGEAFKTNILRGAGEMLPRLRVPVVVDVHLEWHDEDTSVPPWGPAFAVWERARDMTPLPGSCVALKDYPAGDVAQIERAAGRDPLSRLRHQEVRG